MSTASNSVAIRLRQRIRATRGSMPDGPARILATVGPAFAVLAIQVVFFPMKPGFMLQGATIGLLTALIAVGMALVYRANRVLNFSQGDLGYVPGLLGVMLVTITGVNYFVGFIAGLASAIVLGALVEMLIIRRFSRSARLILTVVTLGLSQILAFGALSLARLWDAPSRSQRVDFPWEMKFELNSVIFREDYVVAWIVGPLAMVAIAAFLRGTAVGTAIRAAADSADRASLLGIPVNRLHTIVWSVATTLAFIAIWLRAGIIGLPVGSVLSFGILLRALAALMLGNLTNLPGIALSATVLGILETAIIVNGGSSFENDAILAGVIIVSLLIRSILARQESRADNDSTSTWQAAEEVRPVPPELRGVREVQAVRALFATTLVVTALVLPHFLDTAQLIKASAVLIFGIIGISVIVLTGWAGQVSLGQMAFVAFGAAVTAKLTNEWNVDLILALMASAAVGALVAIVVGLPALRQRGLFLAVSSLGFSLATTSYFLNESFWIGSWVHDNTFKRVPLLGRIDIDSPIRMYYVALIVLTLVMVAMRGVRRTRTGRVLLALRENESAAQTFGISPLRAKLTGFAMSGAIAAIAGGLFAYNLRIYTAVSFQPDDSIEVFVMAVIGGLGSLAGGVIGALYLKGLQWFLPAEWVFFASGVGVLVVLLIIPSGIGGLLFRIRDQWLRWVAKRKKIIVPSLLADVAPTRVEEAAVPVTDLTDEATADPQPGTTAGEPA
ncbi:MAG: branched-chain amino acid transport system permease protein [Candidatus Aldehydirespiratoraceae bacterium]|jgi:branched-chain amino acid transport system permease protein